MKYTITYNSQEYNCELLEDMNFEGIKNVSGAHGFIFNDKDEVLLVKFSKKDSWMLPGGGVEDYDDSPEGTFLREMEEETDMEIEKPIRIGYIKSAPKNNPHNINYQLRFTGRILKVNPQTIDPAVDEIPELKFVPIDQFIQYTQWDPEHVTQVERALEILKQ